MTETRKRFAIDVTGLASGLRTGVQNVLWALVYGAVESESHLNGGVVFYDRSGKFNKEIFKMVGDAYIAFSPFGNSRIGTKLNRAIIKSNVLRRFKLNKRINLVWNYDIFDQPEMEGAIYVHDLLPIEHPEWFEDDIIDATKKLLEFAKNNAKHVMCNSFDVQKRVSDYCKFELNRVKVIYPSINQTYFDCADIKKCGEVLKKYGLDDEKYVISSGFIDPRKNLVSQVKAFAKYCYDSKSQINYVLTGNKNSLSLPVLNAINSLGLDGRIRFIGFVPTCDLSILLKNSECVMYCSLAEGFGLPIIEAMASGALVVTSNTTSMQEIGKDRAVLVDPYSVDSIAKGLEMSLNMNAKDRARIINENLEYASRFTDLCFYEKFSRSFNQE